MIYFFGSQDVFGPLWEDVLASVLGSVPRERVHVCYQYNNYEFQKLQQVTRLQTDRVHYHFSASRYQELALESLETLLEDGSKGVFISNNPVLIGKLGAAFDEIPQTDGDVVDLLVVANDGRQVSVYDCDFTQVLADSLGDDPSAEPSVKVENLRLAATVDGVLLNDSAVLATAGSRHDLEYRGQRFKAGWPALLMERVPERIADLLAGYREAYEPPDDGLEEKIRKIDTVTIFSNDWGGTFKRSHHGMTLKRFGLAWKPYGKAENNYTLLVAIDSPIHPQDMGRLVSEIFFQIQSRDFVDVAPGVAPATRGGVQVQAVLNAELMRRGHAYYRPMMKASGVTRFSHRARAVQYLFAVLAHDVKRLAKKGVRKLVRFGSRVGRKAYRAIGRVFA